MTGRGELAEPEHGLVSVPGIRAQCRFHRNRRHPESGSVSRGDADDGRAEEGADAVEDGFIEEVVAQEPGRMTESGPEWERESKHWNRC